MVSKNLAEVRNRITRTCVRLGRDPKDVILVAVSKTFGNDLLREAIDLGQRDFGENYVQELTQKRREILEPEIRWHFIGHLQSNKVKQIVDLVHLIHSIDNESVAGELNRRAGTAGRPVDILLEVHTTDEATKFGVRPEHTVDLAKSISRLQGVRIQGLMTMGPFSGNPDDSRPSFQQLRHLRQKIEAEGIDNVSMRHLSMGMSHDFEVAIEEGATIVRIGTAIFGKRKNTLNEQTTGEL